MWQVRGTVQWKANTSSALSNQQVPFFSFMAQKLHYIAANLQELWTVIRNKRSLKNSGIITYCRM